MTNDEPIVESARRHHGDAEIIRVRDADRCGTFRFSLIVSDTWRCDGTAIWREIRNAATVEELAGQVR